MLSQISAIRRSKLFKEDEKLNSLQSSSDIYVAGHAYRRHTSNIYRLIVVC